MLGDAPSAATTRHLQERTPKMRAAAICRVGLAGSVASTLGSFIWSIADRRWGPDQYRDAIRPVAVRVDCDLEKR